jgi:hypothetical protein
MAGSILSLPRDQPDVFRTALELARADPEQPRDILQAIAPEAELKLEAANEEIARLQEKNKVLAEENRQLKAGAANYNPKEFFDLIESLSMNLLGPALEDQAIDSDEREIARELRVRPDELRHYLNKGTKIYLEAIEELRPLLDAAAKKLSEQRKPGSAESKNDHRANLLLEKLESRSEIRTSQAMDIIDGDEGVKPNRMMTLRAMKRAAEIRPHKAEFVPGIPGDIIGSILRRR